MSKVKYDTLQILRLFDDVQGILMRWIVTDYHVFHYIYQSLLPREGKVVDHLYAYPLLPPIQKHSTIHLQLRMWDDYF